MSSRCIEHDVNMHMALWIDKIYLKDELYSKKVEIYNTSAKVY